MLQFPECQDTLPKILHSKKKRKMRLEATQIYVGRAVRNSFKSFLILIRLKIPKYSLSVFCYWSLSPLSAQTHQQ